MEGAALKNLLDQKNNVFSSDMFADDQNIRPLLGRTSDAC